MQLRVDWRRLLSEAPSIVKPGVIIPIAIGTAFLGAAVVIGIQLFGGGARCLERKGPEHERLKEENMPINKQKMVEPIVGDIEDNGTKEIQKSNEFTV